MLTCIPQSLCSWDFHVSGSSGGPATVAFNFFTEEGGVSLGGQGYVVRKQGWLSGHWILECVGQTYADAHKPNALFRSFTVDSRAGQLIVKAESPFTRCYHIVAGGSVVGTIRPVHPFTRRAFIECDSCVPELIQLFSFWLAVLTWRRAARDNSAAT